MGAPWLINPWGRSSRPKDAPNLDQELRERKRLARMLPKPKRPLGTSYFLTLPESQLSAIANSRHGWTNTQRAEARRVLIAKQEPDLVRRVWLVNQLIGSPYFMGPDPGA